VPQVVITMPLLEGTDGVRKMSKSFGNYIALEDQPGDMFGKIMSISDELMFRYYELLTSNDLQEIKKRHPMEAKIALAELIVSCYYGVDEAKQEKEEFEIKFRNREFPNTPDATVILKKEDFRDLGNLSYSLLDLIMRAGLTPSKGEARRLIAQGAVIINNERYQDVNAIIAFQNESEYKMKIGKRKYVLVKVSVD